MHEHGGNALERAAWGRVPLQHRGGRGYNNVRGTMWIMHLCVQILQENVGGRAYWEGVAVMEGELVARRTRSITDAS